ncbi:MULTISPECIES: hypothetical protein [Bradyrhizobium]|uniref:hypothetical protein n=1 Tax=Bradyrhizobium TaxID=374 RepID=UPI0006766F20|nr:MULTISPECIES: hypothetical protein [Bradyrhizobium]MBR0884017.1 hypothetical protein [Bradyrhizobium liaoningense]MBR1004933.1 hypothetical protein [Bradyrhizobium liaoningense]MBR1034280.1 hypothetical protein [Bradyrhizobium liaoningense]MBR1071119.1 hypothetical protein [Bradyrhizobium liaoningense]MCP1775061.1 putative chitinase [Bradyrhizobium japonicum]
MPDTSKEPHVPPENGPISLEERKFQLEVQKFEFEKSKSRGLRFFNSNLGVIITAIIGTATIAVSYLQLQINRESSANQLELQRSTNDAQLTLEKSKASAAQEKDERTFQFDVARLMLERQSDINTEEIKRVYYLREIVMSALPNTVGSMITRRAADHAADDRVRSAWLDGFVKLALAETRSSVTTQQPSISVDYVLARYSALKTPDGVNRIADILDAAREFNLNDSVAIILAYALFTSDFFNGYDQYLNIVSAELIAAMLPNIFPNASDAKPFVGNARSLANKVYSGRFGNVGPDDGWNYRGRGYLHTVGKANYARSGALIGIDLVGRPEKLAESKVAAREIAAAFAALSRPITVDGAVRQLNGRLRGLAGIQGIYEKLAPGTPKVTEGLTIPSVGKSCTLWC